MKNILKFTLLAVAILIPVLSFANSGDNPVLASDDIRISWSVTDTGVELGKVEVRGGNGWKTMPLARYGHRVLYSAEKPGTEPLSLYDAQGKEMVFPEAQYRYILASWQQNNTAVSLNKAGEDIVYVPDSYRAEGDAIVLCYGNGIMEIEEKWCIDDFGDLRVEMTLLAKKSGWWSLASPSIAVADKYDFRWATVPGIYQGRALNPDYVRALAYGQGIPAVPVVSRERTASTLTSIITDNQGITMAVTAEPGTGRDPWEYDGKTNSVWKLGLSLMNRDMEFTPTLYHPVLGEAGSWLNAGDSVSFSFRYTLRESDWYSVLKHAAEDIYRFADCLKLKKTSVPLTERLYRMHSYLVNDSTSMWRNCDFTGVTIGAQDYRGGVYGSEKDAMKNSDYGAMWMLAALTGDSRLTSQRLPYALNFKLMQQNCSPGFMFGSSSGQYYLYKSSRFTEEWGPYTEPIATTYYMLMDMGNILKFEPKRKDLKEHLRSAADCLLEWMKEDGSWEVAYDNATGEPMFTDTRDYRPTFYGLLVAYDVLGDRKYLDAACKGADWYVENAVQNGCFLGVCGDTRFAPDFATVQGVQALLDLAEVTGEEKYREAALAESKIYVASVYTHPVPDLSVKMVKGVRREDWEITQAGLGFEHGGVLGSANHRGPVLLASHAGLFVRLYDTTRDSIYLNMSRAAAIGRDAFVDMKTGVASYYWDSMNNGAGPYPHHAWWQIGWITDYLISEAGMRSGGHISFPCGYMTPKVGPHKSYGFAPGQIYGSSASLVMRQGLVRVDNPYFEYLTAFDRKSSTLYLVLMNNDDEYRDTEISLDASRLFDGKHRNLKSASVVDADGAVSPVAISENLNIGIGGYGLKVLKLKY